MRVVKSAHESSLNLESGCHSWRLRGCTATPPGVMSTSLAWSAAQGVSCSALHTWMPLSRMTVDGEGEEGGEGGLVAGWEEGRAAEWQPKQRSGGVCRWWAGAGDRLGAPATGTHATAAGAGVRGAQLARRHVFALHDSLCAKLYGLNSYSTIGTVQVEKAGCVR